MKKVSIALILIVLLLVGISNAIAADSGHKMPAPNSGDGNPDGSGFDKTNGPNGSGSGEGYGEPAPNSGDGDPDGSGH